MKPNEVTWTPSWVLGASGLWFVDRNDVDGAEVHPNTIVVSIKVEASLEDDGTATRSERYVVKSEGARTTAWTAAKADDLFSSPVAATAACVARRQQWHEGGQLWRAINKVARGEPLTDEDRRAMTAPGATP